MDLPPPQICTARLKPFRQRINRTIMTITDNGCVSMEIMCRHGNQSNSHEITKELFHISPDGKNVEVYQSADGVSAMDGCPIPGQPYKLFAYPDLPVKQMKKYQHAYKFVELVKSRTAKVVLVTDTAQCKLMENSEPADFKADFHDGSTVVISKSMVTVTDKTGGSLTFDVQSVSRYISPDTLRLVQHAHMCHHKCLEIEKSMSGIQSTGVNNDMFPVTIGSTRHPCHVVPVCQENLRLNEVHQPPPAHLPHCQTQTLLSQGEPSTRPDVHSPRSDPNRSSGPQQARPVSESICSEAELCDLFERQFTEFSGSSRSSSVNTNMSRSVTPQKLNSIVKGDELKNTQTQASFQQLTTNTLSTGDASFNNNDIVNAGQLEFHSSAPNRGNEHFCEHIPNVPNSDHIPYVPSHYLNNPENIEASIASSSISDATLLPRELFHSQAESTDILDSSIGSNNLAYQNQQCLSTPCRNITYQQKQQQQQLNHSHGISVDSWKRCHQQHNHLDGHAQLLLEHRHNLVHGQHQTGVPGPSVRRSLFTDFGLDLSQPVSSPVPSFGTDALHQDLLVIQPTPSLDLSDCSGGADENGQFEEDTYLKLPYSHVDQSRHQPASDNLLEDFNMSLSIPPGMPDPSSTSESFDVKSSMSISHPRPESLISTNIVEEIKRSRESTAMSSTDVVPPKASTAETPHTDFLISTPSSQQSCCSKPVSYPAPPLPPLSNSDLQATTQEETLNLSSSSSCAQKTFAKPPMSLGLITTNITHKDTRRGSSGNIYGANFAGGGSNTSSSNSSSNISGCLDLSPQPALMPPSLPAQLRHSLDMSASSHYSDSSAPSSSGAGDVIRQLFVPYTGWASLHVTGAVWVLYNDGTQVGIKSTEAAMIYVDQDGTETKYFNADEVPEIVRLKLEKLPTIVDQLMKAPATLTTGLLPQSGTAHKV